MSFLIDKITKKTPYVFVTIHEIINERKFLNYFIIESVTELFIKNPELIYLKDDKNNNIEIPTVLYYGTESEMVNFITIFGVKKQANIDLFGPYYYFFNYEDALRYGGWTNDFKKLLINKKLYTMNKYGKYKNGSIIRFAVFLKNINVKLNLKNDVYDNAILTKKLKENNIISLNLTNYSNIKKTSKISDRNGIWSNNFDTIYTSKSNLINSSVFSINDINNAVCISIQNLDSKELPEKYDKNLDTSKKYLL